MSTSIIVFLVFLALFFISFVLGLIVFVIIFYKTQKLKKAVLSSGYSPSTVSGGILPAQEQLKNFKDSYGYSLFSFEYYLISNFGKEILSQVNNENYKAQMVDLRKIYHTYTRLLFSGLLSLLISIAIFFLMRNSS